MRLAEECTGKKDFSIVFDQFWNRFDPGSPLNVKLELLHRCLTPELLDDIQLPKIFAKLEEYQQIQPVKIKLLEGVFDQLKEVGKQASPF
ncbi:MAG: hypothetical protein IPJ40_24325 [Saprospirales bacterium]|nr:hypothetical protein [Saprospirales bacterium]